MLLQVHRIYWAHMEMEGRSSAHSLHHSDSVTTARIQSLTDGVFAFAMTVLILNFRTSVDIPSESLTQILFASVPAFSTYFLSFVALGALWVADQNHFRWITRADRTFLWINIFFQSFVALIPVSTALLRSYYENPLAVVLYGTILIICSIGLYLQWAYAAHRRRLISDETSETTIRLMKSRILVPAMLVILASLYAFVSSVVSLYMFAVIFALAMIPATSDKIIKIIREKL